MLTAIANFIIDVVVGIITSIFSLFPATPFQFPVLDWGPFGLLIGTVFPVGTLFLHMTFITTAVLFYYAIRWLLRTIKMIQ